jgi:hypothetical protein
MLLPLPLEPAELLAPLEAELDAPPSPVGFVDVEPLDLLDPELLPGPVPVVELLLHASADIPRPKAAIEPNTRAIFTDFIRYAFQ